MGGNNVLITGATADLVRYLGWHDPVSQMVEKFKPMYGTVASLDFPMQSFL